MTTSRLARERTLFWTGATLLGGVHAALANYFVPMSEVFSNRPLQGDDFDLHIGQVFRVTRALEDWGRSWLYDVQLLAGQPEGTITDSGSKGWELWTFALHHLGVPTAIAFNSFVMLVMLSAPLLIFAAARSFKLSANASLIAAMMTSTIWFFDSHVHWIWFVGMVSWAIASCIAVLTIGLFQRVLDSDRPWPVLGCSLSVSIGLLIHPYSFFVTAPAMTAMYLRDFKRVRPLRHASVLGVAVVALAVNAYWLHNAALHWHYILNSAFYAQAKPVYLLCDVLDVLCSGADTGVIGTRTGFRCLYLGLAAAGLWLWRRQGDPRFLPVILGILSLYGVAYFGGYVPSMQQTQPYRQITPATLMTTLPAACFVDWLWSQRPLELPRATRVFVAVIGCALAQQLITGQVTYFLPNLIPDPQLLLDGSRSPLSKYGYLWAANRPSHVHYGVPHDPSIELGVDAVVAWSGQLPPGTRVLVEGAVLGERLAWRTKLEILGGFFERNLTHVDANYFREHQNYSAKPNDLAHYLEVFAVEWVIGNRPEFERSPQLLERITTIGGRNLYRTKVGVNRVLQGGGHVDADENRIEARGSDPKQTLLLSYHWHEALRCKPNCRVEREDIDIDRVGFIRIPAPHPTDVLVWNSYEMR